MTRIQLLTQGGAAPKPLPAPRPKGIGHSIRHFVLSLPPLVRAGFAILGIGALADMTYHAIHGLHSHTHSGGFDAATGIHLLVGAGMVITLAGLVLAGIRSTRTSTRHKEAIR